jgi:hypothetical protein
VQETTIDVTAYGSPVVITPPPPAEVIDAAEFDALAQP